MKTILRKIKAIFTLKSKTANMTAIVAFIISLCRQFGVEWITPEVVTAIFTILAFILRMVTTKALEDK